MMVRAQVAIPKNFVEPIVYHERTKLCPRPFVDTAALIAVIAKRGCAGSSQNFTELGDRLLAL